MITLRKWLGVWTVGVLFASRGVSGAEFKT